MSQVKVPVEKICSTAPEKLVKHGIIGDEEKTLIIEAAAKLLRIAPQAIENFSVLRKSLDARKKYQMMYIYQVEFKTEKEEKLLKRYGKNDAKIISSKGESEVSIGAISLQKRPVIVGLGPAGLFAGLELARAGYAPILLERGSEVEIRQKKVTRFWETGVLDTESNVQFGEGGAGTFSDGKLNTLVKDPTGMGKKVFRTFVDFGAPSEILYLQKPHIGTDRLREVVKNMRQEICALGGEVFFDTKFEKAIWEHQKLSEIVISDTFQGEKRTKTIPCDTLILATGHSARDTVTRLYEDGVLMQAKPFAIGVRVEHSQKMIGENQYGGLYQKLPVADYKLTYTTKQGRGVYSFCMCPGGYVVNASSEPGHLVVNGMSDYERDSANANSAIVVTVDPQDFMTDLRQKEIEKLLQQEKWEAEIPALAGIAFQRQWEAAAYALCQGKIPVQLLEDFRKNQTSSGFGEVLPCMKGKYEFANVRSALPQMVGDAIAEGMIAFERRITGYGRADALLSGIEGRTSSPVKIPRDDSLQANIQGIYPCGEGAGYAGGITSAAMDGIRVAQKIMQVTQ